MVVLYVYVCMHAANLCNWEPTLNKFDTMEQCEKFRGENPFVDLGVTKTECRKSVEWNFKKIHYDLPNFHVGFK